MYVYPLRPGARIPQGGFPGPLRPPPPLPPATGLSPCQTRLYVSSCLAVCFVYTKDTWYGVGADT